MTNLESEIIASIKRGLSWVELKESLNMRGCPVCNTMKRTIEKYFEFLLYEYALDAAVHKKTLASFGMCNTHTYLLKIVEQKLKSDGLNISVLYETLFQKEEKLLAEIEEKELVENAKSFAGLKKKKDFISHKKEILSGLAATGTCPGCIQQQQSESFYTHEILRLYKDVEFRNKIENENILLCRRHFIFTINESENDDAIKYFNGVQKKKIELLHMHLKGFIQNHDYKSKKEMTEKEINSWTIALEYFGSKEGINREGYNELLNQ